MNVNPLYNIFTPWKVELFYRVKSLFTRRHRSTLSYPNKILLCNQGALGDVFLTTCMIPSLKKTFPDSRIGMAVAPPSLAAVKGCPGIDAIHLLDPWFHPLDSKWQKLSRRIKRKIPAWDYDWVICTFPFYRGVGASLRQIPHRICFETLGDRIYFNHVIPWHSGYTHRDSRIGNFANLCGFKFETDEASLIPMNKADGIGLKSGATQIGKKPILELRCVYIGEQYERLLEEVGVEDPRLICPWELPNETKDYVLFHIGSSDPTKEFSTPFWRDLYEVYRAEGRRVLFTGSGERQEKLIQQIALPEENYCNRLSFFEFLQKVAQAEHIISVDTVTVHVAAILKKRYFALFQKELNIPLWYPNTEEGDYILCE